MENNLMAIGKRFHQLKIEMLHGGYTGEFLENHIMGIISMKSYLNSAKWKDVKTLNWH